MVSGFINASPAFFNGFGTKGDGKRFGKARGKRKEEIWNKLSPQIKTDPGVLAIAKDVAINPDNEMAKTTLAYHLQKILDAPGNAVLKAEIAQILEEAPKEGKFNIDAKGSQIGVIGDRGKVIMNFGSKP